MSVSIQERLPRLDHLLNKYRAASELSRHAVAEVVITPEEPDHSLVAELDQINKPVARLSLVVNHLQEFNESGVEPMQLVESFSHDTLEWLHLLDEEAAQRARTYGGKTLSIVLGFSEIHNCLKAWEVHPTNETEELARAAIDHSSNADIKQSFHDAFNISIGQPEVTIKQALAKVAHETTIHLESKSHRVEYPWLFDSSVSKPDKFSAYTN